MRRSGGEGGMERARAKGGTAWRGARAGTSKLKTMQNPTKAAQLLLLDVMMVLSCLVVSSRPVFVLGVSCLGLAPYLSVCTFSLSLSLNYPLLLKAAVAKLFSSLSNTDRTH
jgi:hypothetical protein